MNEITQPSDEDFYLENHKVEFQAVIFNTIFYFGFNLNEEIYFSIFPSFLSILNSIQILELA